jgi:hypothetical protein
MDTLTTIFDNYSHFQSSHSLRDSINPLIVAILTAAAAAVIRAIEKHRMNKKRKL